MRDVGDAAWNGLVFDEVADLYDEARPLYPDALYDDLVELASLGPTSRVLEIGAGTGQATRGLAHRGLSVLCLEPGPRLSELARQNVSAYPDVQVASTTFEDWPLERGAFDLILSAQAFHWVDPAVRLQKARAALRPGGRLALVDHVGRRARSSLNRAIDECYEQLAPSHTGIGGQKRTAAGAELEHSALFRVRETRHYTMPKDYSAEEYVRVLRTYSDHHKLREPEKTRLLSGIARAIDEHGGRLRIDYAVKLVVAQPAVAQPEGEDS